MTYRKKRQFGESSGEQAKGNGNDGEVLFQDVPVSFGEDPLVTSTADNAGDYCFFAGGYGAIPFSLT